MDEDGRRERSVAFRHVDVEQERFAARARVLDVALGLGGERKDRQEAGKQESHRSKNSALIGGVHPFYTRRVIAERLGEVRARIAAAANRAGRDPADVELIAVSKIKPAADILEAYAADQRIFGESYVQEFQSKRPELGDLPSAQFHLIGKLQSNKTRIAAGLFDVVQTVASEKIARRLNDQAERTLGVFLEVKLSDEETKGGMSPEQVGPLADFVRACPNLRLRGLMTMPPWSEDAEVARPYFQQLRELAERHGLKELSMGMTNDFEVAIEEGATCVRVGTAIFGKRPKPA